MASPLGPLRLVGEALKAFAAKHPDLFALGRKDLELPKYPVPDAEPTQDYLARLAGSGGLDYIGRRYERPGGQHFQLNDRAIPTFGMTYTAADLNAIRKTGVTPMTIMSRIHDRPTVETVFPGMKTYDIDASSASAPGVPALGVQSYYPLWDVLEHVGGINHTSGLTSDNLVRKPQALQSYMMRGNSGDQVAGSDEFFQELGSHPIDRDLRRHFLAADPGDDYGTDIAYARQFKRMSPAERIGALAAANRASLEARLRMSIGQDPATDRLLSQSQWPMSRPAFADTVTPNLTNKVDQEMGGVWRMGGTSRKRALLHDWLLNRAYEGQPVDAGQLDQAYRDFPQFFQGLYFKEGGYVGDKRFKPSRAVRLAGGGLIRKGVRLMADALKNGKDELPKLERLSPPKEAPLQSADAADEFPALQDQKVLGVSRRDFLKRAAASAVSNAMDASPLMAAGRALLASPKPVIEVASQLLPHPTDPAAFSKLGDLIAHGFRSWLSDPETYNGMDAAGALVGDMANLGRVVGPARIGLSPEEHAQLLKHSEGLKYDSEEVVPEEATAMASKAYDHLMSHSTELSAKEIQQAGLDYPAMEWYLETMDPAEEGVPAEVRRRAERKYFGE